MFFETGFSYTVHAGFEPMVIYLPRPLEYWNYLRAVLKTATIFCQQILQGHCFCSANCAWPVKIQEYFPGAIATLSIFFFLMIWRKVEKWCNLLRWSSDHPCLINSFPFFCLVYFYDSNWPHSHVLKNLLGLSLPKMHHHIPRHRGAETICLAAI